MMCPKFVVAHTANTGDIRVMFTVYCNHWRVTPPSSPLPTTHRYMKYVCRPLIRPGLRIRSIFGQIRLRILIQQIRILKSDLFYALLICRFGLD